LESALAGSARGVSWERVLAAAGGESFARPRQRRVHRHWFVDSTMDELLQTDFTVDEKDRLYRCLDRVLAHKQELFRVAEAEVGGSVRSGFRSAAL
jgi:hypothetical protein